MPLWSLLSTVVMSGPHQRNCQRHAAGTLSLVIDPVGKKRSNSHFFIH